MDRWPTVALACLPALKANRFTARCNLWGNWALKDGDDLISEIEVKDGWLNGKTAEEEQECESGIAWVSSLDGAKTERANQLTAKWVEEWLAKQ